MDAPNQPHTAREAALMMEIAAEKRENATLREALQSVGNDYYMSPGAWPDHIRALAYPE